MRRSFPLVSRSFSSLARQHGAAVRRKRGDKDEGSARGVLAMCKEVSWRSLGALLLRSRSSFSCVRVFGAAEKEEGASTRAKREEEIGSVEQELLSSSFAAEERGSRLDGGLLRAHYRSLWLKNAAAAAADGKGARGTRRRTPSRGVACVRGFGGGLIARRQERNETENTQESFEPAFPVLSNLSVFQRTTGRAALPQNERAKSPVDASQRTPTRSASLAEGVTGTGCMYTSSQLSPLRSLSFSPPQPAGTDTLRSFATEVKPLECRTTKNHENLCLGHTRESEDLAADQRAQDEVFTPTPAIVGLSSFPSTRFSAPSHFFSPLSRDHLSEWCASASTPSAKSSPLRASGRSHVTSSAGLVESTSALTPASFPPSQTCASLSAPRSLLFSRPSAALLTVACCVLTSSCPSLPVAASGCTQHSLSTLAASSPVLRFLSSPAFRLGRPEQQLPSSASQEAACRRPGVDAVNRRTSFLVSAARQQVSPFARSVSHGSPPFRRFSVPLSRRLSSILPGFPRLLTRPATAGSCASSPSSASPLSAFFSSRALSSLSTQVTPEGTMAGTAEAVSSGSATATETEKKTQEQQHIVLKPTKQPVEKHRLDYKPADFLIDFVDLDFDLNDERTKVTSTLTLHRRSRTPPADLMLDGEDLELESVELDGQALALRSAETQKQEKKEVYSLDVDGRLVLSQSLLPAEAEKKFVLKTVVYIKPKENLQLMGLYKSGALLVTQCEAEGFRRITYFLDRPDVMSLFRVRLAADAKKCSVLLSNGNLVQSGKVDGQEGRHFAVFEDPSLKPCYLFALVAGDLKSISDTFTTMSGRNVTVSVFSEPQDSSKLTWALESVVKSMKWDEERFGREYDLDVFNVVCAKDFNMGAMENKGLNIFNAALLLADPKTTTDAEYQRILNVVGHEYFHNWTGNRVTCRDWFQLTLKEGLTVFRDQLFTADMCSAAVKRIEDVIFLRSRQFAEDSGPMAHPIRPETYIAMDNFYTATVYDKGAEVIRMYHTLLGEQGFRRGMDLYFQRHDGQAVTCDDFRAAMADANGRDFSQFGRWYFQAGTPEIEVVKAEYDTATKKYVLTLKQRTPPTPGQPEKMPFHIPVKVGLIGRTSKTDLLKPATKVLELTEAEQTFELEDVPEDCVLSFLRDFSAPVKVINPHQTDDDIAFLMAHDSDDFSKWQAAHTLAAGLLKQRAEAWREKQGAGVVFEPLPKTYLDAFKQTLLEEGRDKSVQAYTLRLPDRESVAQDMKPIDPEALKEAAESIRREVGGLLKQQLLKVYDSLAGSEQGKESRDQDEVARRRLRNVILFFLTGEKNKEAAALAMKHFRSAKGMTEKYAALCILADMESPERTEALEQFYKDAEGDALVLDKWFAVQALADLPNVTATVKALQAHPDFTAKNPNRLRALVFSFTRNPQFHSKDGAGYALLADAVLEVDSFNPQIAARGAGAFLPWKKYDAIRQREMLKQLRRIAQSPGLSPDTLEIVQKALAGAEEEPKN
ncbi:putative aminopeptidase N [Besnoitia besnoiti]|uniref:Putative aminopeptidase N n=1 Tax=Besnoitia besnoiti TaxID=94643 RepID=A0A2A9MIV7_BESBE|nr:putative aminopeptidase N [Besnoitia besnoiti]PFH35330.1 putative aminopeptidase N [Besnoitia besnoiti]